MGPTLHKGNGLPKRQTCLLNKLGNKLRPDIEYQNKPNR